VWVRLRFLVNAAKFRRELLRLRLVGIPSQKTRLLHLPRRGSQEPRLRLVEIQRERKRVLLHLLQGSLRVAVQSLQETKCLRETMTPRIYQVLGSRSHGVLGFVRSAAE